MDVKTAFLYGKINAEIYVKLLPGFEIKGKVCKLKKALYGLKQAPRIWYQTLTTALRDLGYEPCPYNHTVFKKGSTLILAYVDNLLIAGPNLEQINQLKADLQKRFQIKDIGECKFFLRIGIERSEGKIRLTQTALFKAMMEKFGLADANPTATPYVSKDR
ncbi:unnamed protein product [Zymoseptoria tritici ST99CH_3D1]|nr:unnamed protein product [Zymoseptoria tritici ST99CH_3D1]